MCSGVAGRVEGVRCVDREGRGEGLTEQEKYDVLHELRVKRVQFNDALVQALGLRVEARMGTGKGVGRMLGLVMSGMHCDSCAGTEL